jgi:3-hydroxyisobutyrate dehydrogenase
MNDRPHLGFIGIGIMGTAMMLRLLERGWRVTAWNKEPERLPPVIEKGAVAAADPREVAARCDILLLCVLHTEAVNDVIWGTDGAAQAEGGARLVIDFSTIHPDATRDFAARLRRKSGAGWVDAPCSGGPNAARDGTLAIMAGGDEADFAAALPVLHELGANVTRMGPVGAGQTTKIINQAIVGTGFVVMAEALALAEASGIAADRLPAALAGGFAESRQLQLLYPQMRARAFEPPTSYARQLLKDMKAVKEFAHDLGLTLPVVEQAGTQYAAHVANGNEMKDSASIIALYAPAKK